MSITVLACTARIFYWTFDTPNVGENKQFTAVGLKMVSSRYICILVVFSTEQEIIRSYCMLRMQVGLPPHRLSVRHITDFFSRATGRTEKDLCWEDNSRVGIGKSVAVSTFCHSGALNAPPIVLRASTASNLAADSCRVCALVCVCLCVCVPVCVRVQSK